MKLTNKLGLPQTIVDAVANDSYTKGKSHISITGLLKPPRMRVLEKVHADKLEEDVSARIYALLGQVTHGILERAARDKAPEDAIFEKRYYIEVEGIIVSGQLDAYYFKDDGLVQDYKLVSVYKVKDGVPLEYEQQLNMYAALLRHNGLTVNKLELVCILRDWSKGQASRDENIPQQQVIKLNVPVWDNDKSLAFLADRVRQHKEANVSLPECTPEDRWATPDKWAVMPRKGAARSLKNHNTREEAEIHTLQVKGSFVEKRPGENVRCESYCKVKEHCEQYKKLKAQKE